MKSTSKEAIELFGELYKHIVIEEQIVKKLIKLLKSERGQSK